MTRIVYDDKNRNAIINNLNDSIKSLNEINDLLYNIDIPYEFFNRSEFFDKKNIINKSKDDLIDYKDNFNKFIEEMNKDELEISSKFNALDEIIVNKFE